MDKVRGAAAEVAEVAVEVVGVVPPRLPLPPSHETGVGATVAVVPEVVTEVATVVVVKVGGAARTKAAVVKVRGLSGLFPTRPKALVLVVGAGGTGAGVTPNSRGRDPRNLVLSQLGSRG